MCNSVGGQGIASGFRDAISLAWRLAVLCSSPKTLDHEPILTGWYQERKQQLDKSLAVTVHNGSMVNTRSAVYGYLRNWLLWGMKLIPQWKHMLEQGPRAQGPSRYKYIPGFPFLPELNGGLCFAQTYCTAVARDKEFDEGRILFTDDVIFSENKKMLFQVVVLLQSLSELEQAVDSLSRITKVGHNLLSADEATFFVPRRSVKEGLNQNDLDRVRDRLFRSANAEEFGQSQLCLNRPAPRGYREMLLWESTGKRYAILRPDRFIFAICDTSAELDGAVRRLAEMFSSSNSCINTERVDFPALSMAKI